MPFPIRKVQTLQEKVIDYQYIRSLKNREVRKSRFKRTLSQRILRLFLMCVLITELGYLAFHGFQFFKSSAWFLLNTVEVTGAIQMKPEEIRKIVLANHTSALSADLTQIKLRLENHPWIQSVLIWRELPNTIRVHVTERKPVALILSGQLYLVDHHGRVIEIFDKNPKYATLPVLTGFSDISDEVRIREGLRFVNALAVDKNVVKQVSEIHYYDRNTTILYLKGMTSGLLVSHNDVLPMVQKFLRYAEFINKNFAGQKIVDLRYQDQIILKGSYREQL